MSKKTGEQVDIKIMPVDKDTDIRKRTEIDFEIDIISEGKSTEKMEEIVDIDLLPSGTETKVMKKTRDKIEIEITSTGMLEILK